MDLKSEYALKFRVAKLAAGYVRKGWTTDTYARNQNGQSIASSAEEAVCWCATGSVHRALYDLDLLSIDISNSFRNEVIELIQLSFKRITGYSMATFNDAIAKDGEQVAKVFDQIANGE